MAWATDRILYETADALFSVILGAGGAPNVAIRTTRGIAIRRDGATSTIVYYTADSGGTWSSSGEAIADHAATPCTGSAVADHAATPCTGSAVADHAATPCTGSAVADHGAITPGGTLDSAAVYYGQEFGPLAAAGTNYVAQYAGGAAIDDAVGPFARFVPQRTVRIVLGVGGANPVVYTIDGTDFAGNAIQDIITAAGAGTYEGDIAFRTITRVRSNVDPVGTTDVRTGVGFGLGMAVTGIDGVGVDGALEAPTSTDTATGTVVPATAPDGAHTYHVVSRVVHSHLMGSVTVTPPAHNVTQPSTPVLAHVVTQPSTPVLAHVVTQPSSAILAHVVTQPSTPVLTHTIT
jgi:hypothetical protein